MRYKNKKWNIKKVIGFLFSLKQRIGQSFGRVLWFFFCACLEEILFQILQKICIFSFKYSH